jgi:hypothetical protein
MGAATWKSYEDHGSFTESLLFPYDFFTIPASKAETAPSVAARYGSCFRAATKRSGPRLESSKCSLRVLSYTLSMSALTARELRRLRQAHENGYLDATCRENRAIVKAHGLWCWRLKLPMVWFERRSPHSRFGCLRLDMLTTPNMLTGAGQTALKALGEGKISPHDAVWEQVPLARAEKMAHAAFRAAIQTPNYRLNRASISKIDSKAISKIDSKRKRTLNLVPRKRASA